MGNVPNLFQTKNLINIILEMKKKKKTCLRSDWFHPTPYSKSGVHQTYSITSAIIFVIYYDEISTSKTKNKKTYIMAGEWYTTFSAWETLPDDEPLWYNCNATSAKLDVLFNEFY